MRKPVYAIRFLDSIIPLVSISKISSLYLVSVTVQTGLCLTWSQTLKTGFLVTGLIYNKSFCFSNKLHASLSKITKHSILWIVLGGLFVYITQTF